MCDAASRNVPKLSEGVKILVANCLAHGRRQFIEVAQSFPQECRYVLEALGGSITTTHRRVGRASQPRSVYGFTNNTARL
jgi:hypothetical protein